MQNRGLDLSDFDSFKESRGRWCPGKTVETQTRSQYVKIVAKVLCDRVRVACKQGRRRWNVACQQQLLAHSVDDHLRFKQQVSGDICSKRGFPSTASLQTHHSNREEYAGTYIEEMLSFSLNAGLRYASMSSIFCYSSHPMNPVRVR